ncbi:hypothetical protein HW555_003496 [Spodoptera exigua]|uniref:Uncharacterized protein n=1 Tax=Spodoptera exigua TaxID=7107 RepID=A0A835L715_SPOEX|nr:hypothetical protein HW555_003496 [Spodoptera exigua]
MFNMNVVPDLILKAPHRAQFVPHNLEDRTNNLGLRFHQQDALGQVADHLDQNATNEDINIILMIMMTIFHREQDVGDVVTFSYDFEDHQHQCLR